MNKLEVFIERMREIGLSDEQIDEAVDVLKGYNNARITESQETQGEKGGE